MRSGGGEGGGGGGEGGEYDIIENESGMTVRWYTVYVNMQIVRMFVV